MPFQRIRNWWEGRKLESRIVGQLATGSVKEHLDATISEISRLINVDPRQVLLAYKSQEKTRPHVLPEYHHSTGTEREAARTTHQSRMPLFEEYSHENGTLALVLTTGSHVNPQDRAILEASFSRTSHKQRLRASYLTLRERCADESFPNKKGLQLFFDQAHYRGSLREENANRYIVVIDIDNFKHINDCFGHARGDAVLDEVKGILTELHNVLPHNDTYVARIGGDEFAFGGIATEKEIELIKEYLASKLGKKFITGKHQLTGEQVIVPISASIGVRQYTSEDRLEDVLRDADKKMYEDKAQKTYRRRRTDDESVRAT